MINSGYSVAFHVEGGLVNLGEFPRIRKCKRSALSSLAGMQINVMEKAKYLGELTGKGKIEIIDGVKSKYEYLFGSQFQDKFISYAIQSIGTDFAYTDREYFAKRNFQGHFRTMLFGGLTGGFQTVSGNFSERWLGYAYDYFAQLFIQGYNPFDYSQGWRKTGMFSLKAVFID